MRYSIRPLGGTQWTTTKTLAAARREVKAAARVGLVCVIINTKTNEVIK
jgi:hypothetical protein